MIDTLWIPTVMPLPARTTLIVPQSRPGLLPTQYSEVNGVVHVDVAG